MTVWIIGRKDQSQIQMLARAPGKADVHDREPEDLRALTLEAAAITGMPLVGTGYVPGRGRAD